MGIPAGLIAFEREPLGLRGCYGRESSLAIPVGLSINPTRSLAMIFAIFTMCVISGFIISRPIVKAFGLR